jgi:hypothetical protein
MLTNKKTVIVTCLVLAVAVAGVLAVSSLAFAADNPTPTLAAPGAPAVNKARVMVRLLMIQDESRVDALLQKAVDAGKLKSDQVTTIKGLWTEHHSQFAAGKPLVRILLVRNGARVQALLGRAVHSGRLEQPQADKIWSLWEAVHR